MRVRIYQIDLERDEDRIAFEGLDLLEKHSGSRNPDSSIYDCVYEGDLGAANLEDVYRILNLEHPKDHEARSLSVSDIVEVVESPVAAAVIRYSEDRERRIGSETELHRKVQELQELGISHEVILREEQEVPMVDPGFYFYDSFGFQKVDFDSEQAGKVQNTMQVVLLEPGKEARITEIGTSFEAMQRVVAGDIEAIYPFEEEVALIYNDEGKNNGMALNRAVYSEPVKEEMSYHELVSRFRAAERAGRHETGYIVFTEDSFTESYPVEARTYEVSSDNKAFQPGMGGYSIYGSAIDGSDPMVRLEGYMAVEHGGENGWKVETCYQLQQSREIVDIIAGPCFLCSCEGSDFSGLSDEQAKRYAKLFQYPEHFVREGDHIEAIPYNPKGKSQER